MHSVKSQAVCVKHILLPFLKLVHSVQINIAAVISFVDRRKYNHTLALRFKMFPICTCLCIYIIVINTAPVRMQPRTFNGCSITVLNHSLILRYLLNLYIYTKPAFCYFHFIFQLQANG